MKTKEKEIKPCVKMCQKYHKSCHAFFKSLLCFICFLWALWIKPLELVCQYDERKCCDGDF